MYSMYALVDTCTVGNPKLQWVDLLTLLGPISRSGAKNAGAVGRIAEGCVRWGCGITGPCDVQRLSTSCWQST